MCMESECGLGVGTRDHASVGASATGFESPSRDCGAAGPCDVSAADDDARTVKSADGSPECANKSSRGFNGASPGGGELHPELRKRLLDLGIGLSSDLLRSGSGTGAVGSRAFGARAFACGGVSRSGNNRGNSHGRSGETRPNVAAGYSGAAGGSSGSRECASRRPTARSSPEASRLRSSATPEPSTVSSGKVAMDDEGAALPEHVGDNEHREEEEEKPEDEPKEEQDKDEACAPPKRDEILDEMLLQLDDLDARSAALQRTSELLEQPPATRAASTEAAAMATARRGEEPQSPGHAGSASKGGGGSKMRRSGSLRRHPLEGVSLADGKTLASASDFHSRWGKRPPGLPQAPNQSNVSGISATVAASEDFPARATGVSSAVAAARRFANSGAASPSAAKIGKGQDGSGFVVTLPPLKPSASAPGCLSRGWS
eukprot:TRINITY_DN40730_c0_g1_i1.p1 TRINITY_DN40730_c0_g1~~TRINITY_DN40730_c0_g1_i1.p1  ORF type:complete len:431 (-),score=89.92 TRINITY_DN40730_c0_g1_i1:108-1400(-)